LGAATSVTAALPASVLLESAADSPVLDGAFASAVLAAGVVIGNAAEAISVIFGSEAELGEAALASVLLVLVLVFVADLPASGFALLSLDSGWAGVDFGRPFSFVATGGAATGAAGAAVSSIAGGTSVIESVPAVLPPAGAVEGDLAMGAGAGTGALSAETTPEEGGKADCPALD
jgi:hypothetical protein